MLPVLTDVRDPAALAETCRRLGLPPPEPGSVRLGGREASGWVVRVRGLRRPVVCDTRTGVVAYDPADNAHDRYAHLMRFVERCYEVRARLRRADARRAGRKPAKEVV